MTRIAVIEPERHEMVTWYSGRFDKIGRIADECQIPRFSDSLRCELFELLNSREAVQVLEVATRLGNFGNVPEQAAMRKAVSRELKKRGVKAQRGKRTACGLLELVETLSPLFLYFGLPLRTSERSRLVEGLRMIAAEIGVKGDPRDELRRLFRKFQQATIPRSTRQAIRKSDSRDRLQDVWAQIPEAQRKTIRETVAKGLESLKLHNPP